MSNLNPIIAYDDDPKTDRVHHPYSAFNQGYDAFEAGYGKERNPYTANERLAANWLEGWEHALKLADENALDKCLWCGELNFQCECGLDG